MKNVKKYDLLYESLKNVLTKEAILLLDDATVKVESGIMTDVEFGKLFTEITSGLI